MQLTLPSRVVGATDRPRTAALVRRWAWTAPAVLGAGCSVTYVATDSATVRSVAFLLVAAVAIGSILAGVALHRPAGPVFWRFFALCCALFVVGVVVRPWSVAQDGLLAATADVFTLTGYAALVTAVVGVAGPHARSNSFALLDGLVAAAGCAAAAFVFFVLPAVSIPGRPLWVSLLAGAYPLLDVVVVVALLQLAFTSAGGTWSYRVVTVSLVLLVVGDVGYAYIGSQGQLVGSVLLDVPFLGSYTLFAVAALHPTMTELTSAVPRPAQAWSARRLALLVPALCLPALLVVAAPEHGFASHVVSAAAVLVASLLLVRRAVSAVHRHVAAQQTLLYQSTHDALTGLANRVAATERVQALVARSQRSAGAVWAIALDLDHFRLVNDTWGSTVGDRLLASVANRFTEVVSCVEGATVARQGGDEFLVAGPAADGRSAVETALDLAERLRDAVRRPVMVDDLEFLVTVSTGAAVGMGTTSPVSLLRNADTALGRAKSEGRDRCVLYDEAMSAVVAKRLRLGTALRRAIELEELRVAFQPIVAVGSERVQGCEALLRWHLTGEGPVSPAEFIPVAEESGLVVELGEWVLRRSAQTVVEWRRRGDVAPDFYVSVNVSARQLAEGDFVATVEQVLADTGLPARCLVLEITESVMLTNQDASIRLLERLRSAGVRLSLDDFGTGYSSLSHLDRLPVHTVKLDRSFVAALDGPHGNETIVRAVQGISEALGLAVVAEGVETASQLETLRRLEIGYGQGWFWGPAVAADEFVARWSRAVRDGAMTPAP